MRSAKLSDEWELLISLNFRFMFTQGCNQRHPVS